MLSMVLGSIMFLPLYFVIGDFFLSIMISFAIFLGGLDILTCGEHESDYPRGSAVVVGGLFLGMVLGWIGGPSTSMLSLVLSLMIGIGWRTIFG